MKSELYIPEKEVPSFPALYRHRHSRVVVLFVNVGAGYMAMASGLTVSPGHIGANVIGSFDTEWTSPIKDDNWERLPSGSIIKLIQE